MKIDKHYQFVTLEFRNGMTASYTGRVQLDDNCEKNSEWDVVGVKVSAPIPMPDGLYFEDMTPAGTVN